MPRRRDPWWAKLLVIFGALVMVGSGALVVVPRLVANWGTSNIPKTDLIPDELLGENIDGAINLLLLGMDQRTGGNPNEPIRADTIIIVHIPKTHDAAYLISIPRDTEVAIPDFPETNFKGWRTKINAAFAAGARMNGKPDDSTEGRKRGAALTMMTLNGLVPGGILFNGAAIINFDGFRDVLKAIDGVDMCVDVETRSVHFNKQNKYVPGNYLELAVHYNERKVYTVGCYHMKYWEALDYARQRHFDNGDYTRQRHQQQLLKAMFKKLASRGVMTSPKAIADLQQAAGGLLTLDLGSTDVLDWAWTLKGLNSSNIVMIKTNGGRINTNERHNEALLPDSMALLKAVHDDTVDQFLVTHSDWIVKDTATGS